MDAVSKSNSNLSKVPTSSSGTINSDLQIDLTQLPLKSNYSDSSSPREAIAKEESSEFIELLRQLKDRQRDSSSTPGKQLQSYPACYEDGAICIVMIMPRPAAHHNASLPASIHIAIWDWQYIFLYPSYHNRRYFDGTKNRSQRFFLYINDYNCCKVHLFNSINSPKLTMEHNNIMHTFTHTRPSMVA